MMELLIGMYGELIASLMLGLSAMAIFKKKIARVGTLLVNENRSLPDFVRENSRTVRLYGEVLI